MMTPTQHGAFNARWLSFEDVARTFVPVPQFVQLLQPSHSILLGPRGCGKTTLLKMLTGRAHNAWLLSGRATRFHVNFSHPTFEAVYISSDVRWSYELANLSETSGLSPLLSLQAQRIMVTVNALLSLLKVLQERFHEQPDLEANLASGLISMWQIPGTLRSFAHLRTTLLRTASDIRGYLNTADISRLQRCFDSLPPMFYGHAMDAPVAAVDLADSFVKGGRDSTRWALCYDELEIAPTWLRTELLEALRSCSQSILLKLTWTPILPSGLKTSPESAADYKPIRLWHSHVGDPRAFCDELTQDFLRDRFPGITITPDEFFSRSLLASERDDEPSDCYSRDSTEYNVFKDLAEWDKSFRALLVDKRVNPNDPVPASEVQKDQLFRKIKPIALLRSEFSSPRGGRSRKAPTIYAGKEAIYAMSEGNPRWLRGLLSDFADLSPLVPEAGRQSLGVRYADQAKVLNGAGQRFLSLVKASPFKPPQIEARASAKSDVTLFGFVERAGMYFQRQIYAVDFPLDPVGSFTVSEDVEGVWVAVVEQLLELGALVCVGRSHQDVPSSIVGSRFRLSFILAPIYRLGVRTYREAPLKDILGSAQDPLQPELGI